MKTRISLVLCCALLLVSVAACGEPDDTKPSASAPATGSSVNVTPEPTADTISDEDALTKAEEILGKMTLDQKVGQLFVVTPEELDTSKKQKKGMTKLTKKAKQSMKKYHVGGVLLSSKNLKNQKQVKKLISDLQKSSTSTPLYIATEENGGKKSIFNINKKLGSTAGKTLKELGDTQDEGQVLQGGLQTASNLAKLGFNLNLGPVADLADENNLTYGENCFGEDDETVADLIDDYINGMHQGNVATVTRNFPGVGSVKGIENDGLQLVCDKTLNHLRKYEFTPFWASMKADTDMIMVTGIAIPKITKEAIPAFTSPLVVDGLLRDEMMYDGVVISAPMNTEVIIKQYTPDQVAENALVAGCDMLVSPAHLSIAFNGVKSAVKNEVISEKDLNSAVLRILRNKIKRGIIAFQ